VIEEEKTDSPQRHCGERAKSPTDRLNASIPQNSERSPQLWDRIWQCENHLLIRKLDWSRHPAQKKEKKMRFGFF
jgi:hypothetical protein